jgi:hypothetical protein
MNFPIRPNFETFIDFILNLAILFYMTTRGYNLLEFFFEVIYIGSIKSNIWTYQ